MEFIFKPWKPQYAPFSKHNDHTNSFPELGKEWIPVYLHYDKTTTPPEEIGNYTGDLCTAHYTKNKKELIITSIPFFKYNVNYGDRITIQNYEGFNCAMEVTPGGFTGFRIVLQTSEHRKAFDKIINSVSFYHPVIEIGNDNIFALAVKSNESQKVFDILQTLEESTSSFCFDTTYQPHLL